MKKYLFSVLIILAFTYKGFTQCENPTVLTVEINDPGQVCNGSAPFTFIATTTSSSGTGTLSYQWYLGTTAVPGGTNSSYIYTPVITDNFKFVRVNVKTSDPCNTGPANSLPVFLDIVNPQQPTVTISTSLNPICYGYTNSFSISNQTETGYNPSYQWYINSTTNPVGTGATTFNAVLNDGDQVWVEMTSSLPCIIGTNPIASNKILVHVKPIPNPVIMEGNQIVCLNERFTFSTIENGESTYQWKFNGVDLTGATTYMYNATESGAYQVVESKGICSKLSLPVVLSSDPCGVFSTFISGPNPVRPKEQNVVYSVPYQSKFIYEWNTIGGTVLLGQNTNSITVNWDAPAGSVSSYIVYVTETNLNNQKRTLTMYVSPTATSISKSFTQSGIILFPNPTSESFNIDMPESGVAVSYEILDLTGASVAQGNFISTGSAEKITADFGSGLYQVVLRYNDVVTTGRLSKVQ